MQWLWLGLLLLPLTAAAQACPKSAHLAAGYCDTNGDRVADAPTDRRQWLDPDPLVLADVPTSDMSERAARAEPFRLHLEQLLRRRVSYFIARDYSDLIAAYRAGRVHLLNIQTGGVEQAVVCHGFVPLAQPRDAQGEVAGYQMEILVPARSAIRHPSELKGRTLTFVDERSASGYMAPRTLLAKEFGLEAGKDYKFDFSGRQDNSIVGVANGLYQAAAVASAVREDLQRQGLMSADSVRVIYRSPTFPHSPWGVNHRLNPELAQQIQRAIVAYAGPDKVLQSGSRFRPADYLRDWTFMRGLSAVGAEGPACP